MKKKLLIIIPSVLVVIIVVVILMAKSHSISPLSWGSHEAVYAEKGVAIKGYDPVAFHTQNKAVKGDETYSFDWNGATWQFASSDNLELFQTSPDKYAPQFGGYCAFAVSQGFTAEVDPEHWLVKDDKLFIFSNEDVLNDWKKDEANLEKAAKEQWN